jgi:hypothetical protein
VVSWRARILTYIVEYTHTNDIMISRDDNLVQYLYQSSMI